jgi:hypothetical protein
LHEEKEMIKKVRVVMVVHLLLLLHLLLELVLEEHQQIME